MPLSNVLPDSTLVESIADLAKGNVKMLDAYRKKILVTKEGVKEYEDPSLPTPDVLKLSTLTGLVDYWNHQKLSEHNYLIHVESPTCVKILKIDQGSQHQNLVYSVATPVLPKIVFEQFMDTESFIIQLISRFEPTDDLRRLQIAMAEIKSGVVGKMEDDGVSQTVSTKRGVTRTGDTKIENPIFLCPLRTFSEVDQVSSPFAFRMKLTGEGENATTLAALIEADGGAWQATAISRIGDWLRREMDETLKVLA